MKLIDADVVIDALRGAQPAVDLFEDLNSAGEALVASEMTRFEVLSGLRHGEEDRTERLLAEVVFVPVDEAISRLAAGLARAFRPAFSGIEDEDYIVAATAIELEADLLTRNVRHFPMLAGLEPAY